MSADFPYYVAELLGMVPDCLRAPDLFREAAEMDSYYSDPIVDVDLISMDAGGECERLAAKIKVPLANWPGNCYGVACKCVESGAVQGKAIYGVWDGPIFPGSPFYGRAFMHHGWVKLPDGRIFDPTRFVFGGAEPYLWLGDHCEWYDESGGRLAMRLRGPMPTKPSVTVRLKITSEAARRFVVSGLKLGAWRGSCDAARLSWLLKTPPALIPDAKSLYGDLERANLGGYLGIDYRREVLGK